MSIIQKFYRSNVNRKDKSWENYVEIRGINSPGILTISIGFPVVKILRDYEIRRNALFSFSSVQMNKDAGRAKMRGAKQK
jgi:hypothetical protein